MEQFRNNQALEGNSGDAEITVVNIQRFAEDKDRIKLPQYATNLQRVFIIDEAHRGYNPNKGVVTIYHNRFKEISSGTR